MSSLVLKQKGIGVQREIKKKRAWSFGGWLGASVYEPVHEMSNNVVCATSKASDQPAHTRSLIRAFASRLSIL